MSKVLVNPFLVTVLTAVIIPVMGGPILQSTAPYGYAVQLQIQETG